MSLWTEEELRKIASTDEVSISLERDDGTLRRPVIVWAVRHEDNLYVRSVRGRGSDWFRAAQVRRVGQLQVGDVSKAVSFVEEASPEINDALDRAYAVKYRRYAASIIESINSAEARLATLRVEATETVSGRSR